MTLLQYVPFIILLISLFVAFYLPWRDVEFRGEEYRGYLKVLRSAAEGEKHPEVEAIIARLEEEYDKTNDEREQKRILARIQFVEENGTDLELYEIPEYFDFDLVRRNAIYATWRKIVAGLLVRLVANLGFLILVTTGWFVVSIIVSMITFVGIAYLAENGYSQYDTYTGRMVQVKENTVLGGISSLIHHLPMIISLFVF